jgi:hypothetical protein
MKGGWRWGAGRPATHAKTSSYLRLDVRRLAKQNNLVEGTTVGLTWPSGSSIRYRVEAHAIELGYQYPFTEGVRPVSQRISLDRTPCPYGGNRVWFRCPRCSRRVAILYLWGLPNCRTCARLVYPSQSDDATGRSWARTQKVLARLGQNTEGWTVPRRPPGMRKATFDRLWDAWIREKELRDDILAAFVAKYPGL